MSKKNIETEKERQWAPAKLKSYSVEEIMAAGGTTAFANKMGKKNLSEIIEELKKLPKDAFLTDEEAEQALEMLRANK